MPISATDLNKAYLAYFGRPADFTGKTYFATLEQADVIKAFDASAESMALYGSDSTAKINAIYQNLFNRDAEPAGLQYWATLIQQGRVTPAGAAFAILNGAQGTDATSVANKLAASDAFVAALDTTPEIVGYSGLSAGASARAFLKTVDATPASLTAAQAAVATAVANATGTGTGGSNEAGSSYVLTTAQDVVTGTAKNDFFRAVAGVQVGLQDQTTLNSSDIIDGSGGNDTLVVNMTGNSYAGGARIKGIETLQIGTNLPAAAAFDYNVNQGQNEITDVTKVVYDQINAGETLTVQNIVKTGDNLPTIAWVNEATSVAGTATVEYRASAVVGATTNQMVALSNVNALNTNATTGRLNIALGVETLTIDNVSAGKNTLNNVTVVPTANAAGVDLASGLAGLTKVVVTGAGAFGEDANVVTQVNDANYGLTNRAANGATDLGLSDTRTSASNLVSVANTVLEYDASAATGSQAVRFTPNVTVNTGVNVIFKGGTAADYVEFELGNINYNGGAGDDIAAFVNTGANSTFGEGDTMVGGEGADTIQLGLNGVGTYNVSETELRNKSSFGTLDLRGLTTNLTLSSEFVAAADTANSITIRTDKIVQTSDTVATNDLAVTNNNGRENASTHTVNLTKLGSGQSVNYMGGSGSDRIVLNDATFNVLKTLDGGAIEGQLFAAGSNRFDTITVVTNGENVVIDAQDLSNVKNFEGFVLTKNSSAANYNITLTKAFITANTLATDDATNTPAYNDTVFQIGTSNAANNSALQGAGDSVVINVADLLTANNTGRAAGYAGRSFDVTSLENAGVNVTYVGNGGAAVTALTLRGLNILQANGAVASFADVTQLSAANPGAGALFFQGTVADESVTLAAPGNSVDMGGGSDTLNTGAVLTPTGNLNGGAGVDTLNAANNADLSGATVTNFETLTLANAGSVTVGANSALNQFATVKAAAAGGNETINVATGAHTLASLAGSTTLGEGATTVTYAVAAGASLSVAGNAGAAGAGGAANAVFTGAGTLVTTAALTLTGASDTIANVTFSGAVAVTDNGVVARTYSGDAAVNTLIYAEGGAAFTFANFGATDVLNLDGAGVLTAVPAVVTAGATIVSNAAGAGKSIAILSGATFQINGALNQVGDAGEVEAKIIAAGLLDASQVATEFFYVALDNGTSTGIYRVTEAAAAGTAGVLDVAADFSVTLVGTLQGVTDAGTLVAGNFA